MFPTTPTPTDEDKKLAAMRAQLRMSYGLTFNSTHGELVLDDLLKRYGFGEERIENNSYAFGRSVADTAFLEGMKVVVRHILAMTAKPSEKPQPKPTTAKQ